MQDVLHMAGFVFCNPPDVHGDRSDAALVITPLQSHGAVCFGGSEREKGQINTREYNAGT